MKKKSLIPQTRVKNPEPKKIDNNWIIWAAWADRITFEEIKEKTGKNESEVIKIMRKNLKTRSFKLWRKRVAKKSIKHRKKFKLERKKLREKINLSDINYI
ncbi:MAG: TIGR03643 family protein [Pelagibacterales bacterium MED-G40]|nr:MAG: TIGR03643 family protein [Pelagibacterales bacterium MED-G40]|tara:strand:+ start:860 stop:1162 length:303 start_codon:yes stop_codon:yes gene_type:complete